MCVFSEACLMYMNDRRVDEGLRRLHSHKGRWQMVVQFLNRCWTVVSVSLGDMSARYFNHTSRVYMYPRSVRLPAAFTGVFLSRVQVEAELRAAVVWADVHGAPQFTAYLCSHGLGGGVWTAVCARAGSRLRSRPPDRFLFPYCVCMASCYTGSPPDEALSFMVARHLRVVADSFEFCIRMWFSVT